MIETLFSLIPLLLLFLGIVQWAYLRTAQLVVQHAATRGARAAVVILDDDPKYYDDAPRGDLTAGSAGDSSDGVSGVLDLDLDLDLDLGGLSFGGGQSSDDTPPVGARLSEIRSVTSFPLAVLAPPLGSELLSSLSLSSVTPWVRLGVGLLVYNKALSVTTVHQGQAEEPATRIEGLREPVRVKVSYLFRCSVPWVSTLMCRSGRGLLADGAGLSDSEESAAINERLGLVEQPTMRDVLLGWGGHFMWFEAEATLPNHAADYHQDDEGSTDSTEAGNWGADVEEGS